MITSFEDVKREFFALFLGGLKFDQQRFLSKTLSIPSQNYKGEVTVLQIPVTYYKKSFFNLTELSNESYPIVSIQDFPASPVDNWNTFVQESYVKRRSHFNALHFRYGACSIFSFKSFCSSLRRNRGKMEKNL